MALQHRLVFHYATSAMGCCTLKYMPLHMTCMLWEGGQCHGLLYTEVHGPLVSDVHVVGLGSFGRLTAHHFPSLRLWARL